MTQPSIESYVTPECLRFLAQVAFVGIERHQFKEAEAILEAIATVCSQDVNAQIVRAMGHFLMENFVKSAHQLIDCLKQDPANETAQCFLALCFRFVHAKKEAIELSQRLLNTSKDPSVRLVADDILQFFEQQTIALAQLQATQCQHLTPTTANAHAH